MFFMRDWLPVASSVNNVLYFCSFQTNMNNEIHWSWRSDKQKVTGNTKNQLGRYKRFAGHRGSEIFRVSLHGSVTDWGVSRGLVLYIHSIVIKPWKLRPNGFIWIRIANSKCSSVHYYELLCIPSGSRDFATFLSMFAQNNSLRCMVILLQRNQCFSSLYHNNDYD